jgi:hypothetical protein
MRETMDPRLSNAPVDDRTSDDWLGEQGEVDWGGEPSVAPGRRRGGGEVGPTARGDAPAASGSHALQSYDPRRLTVVQRRRAVALIGLVALVLIGVAAGVAIFGSDEPAVTPTTAPAATTEPPVTTPPAATTPPPAGETPATLTVDLPASGSLALGASGEEVETLQTALAALELDPGEVDGVFGAGTEEAVRAFQQANDLAADGIVGPGTAAKLNEVLAAEGVTG